MSKSQFTLSRLIVALILRLLLLSGVKNCSGRSAPNSPSSTVNSATTSQRLLLNQRHHRGYCWTTDTTGYCWTSDTTEATAGPATPQTTVGPATPKRLLLDQRHHRLLLDQRHHRDYCWTRGTTETTAGPATPQRLLLDQRHYRDYSWTREATESRDSTKRLHGWTDGASPDR